MRWGACYLNTTYTRHVLIVAIYYLFYSHSTSLYTFHFYFGPVQTPSNRGEELLECKCSFNVTEGESAPLLGKFNVPKGESAPQLGKFNVTKGESAPLLGKFNVAEGETAPQLGMFGDNLAKSAFTASQAMTL